MGTALDSPRDFMMKGVLAPCRGIQTLSLHALSGIRPQACMPTVLRDVDISSKANTDVSDITLPAPGAPFSHTIS